MYDVFLTAEKVSKIFYPSFIRKKNKIEVFGEISFKLHRGECLGIIGPNGIGKTTLLKIIAGLIKPTKGIIAFHQKQKIGFVTSEERSFFWRLSAYDNLDFFASLCNIDRKIRKAKIIYFLDLFEMKNYKDKLFLYLSSGMKQKLNLIRSIIIEPNLLLLDEPLKNLDNISKNIFLDWLKTALEKDAISTIFVSHELEDLLKICQRIALMEKNYFSIFDASFIKEQDKFSRDVKIKIKSFPNEMKINLDRISIQKQGDACEIIIEEAYTHNRLKMFMEQLWINKIEIVSLEVLPLQINKLIKKLKLNWCG